ncbi:response regulator transcription factor, partial [Curtobacterium citreum]
LATAIRAVATGQATFDAEVGARLVAQLAAPTPTAPSTHAPTGLRDRFPELTPREADVLERIAAGRTNPEIAAELFLTVPTVKSYVNQVFAKLGVRTRAEAVALVLR